MSFDNGAFPHREGRTLMLLPQLPENAQGPSVKSSGVVFYNPAMAGSRTRSVLLFRHAMEEGMLGDGTVYALDGLTASGLRARRWLNELPFEISSRISATIVDLEKESLSTGLGPLTRSSRRLMGLVTCKPSRETLGQQFSVVEDTGLTSTHMVHPSHSLIQPCNPWPEVE